MYKLIIYALKGINKGTQIGEEIFETQEELDKRYDEIFVYENYYYILKPTAWKKENGSWVRMEGY